MFNLLVLFNTGFGELFWANNKLHKHKKNNKNELILLRITLVGFINILLIMFLQFKF
jgi:hypothetical protein